MHLVKINKIEYHPSSKGYILILEKEKNKIKIPILIGSNEAQSLSLAYEDIKLPRPNTHDLIINLVNELDAEIDYVIIKKYQNGTFLSNIIIKRGNEVIELDSRPSDAISTALKSMVPIYVTDDILKTIKSKNIISNQHFPEQTTNRTNEINYNTENIIKDLMKALDKAINDESYEIAAKLRDRIKNLKTKQIN
jgi:bifunctional DNase/RNase